MSCDDPNDACKQARDAFFNARFDRNGLVSEIEQTKELKKLPNAGAAGGFGTAVTVLIGVGLSSNPIGWGVGLLLGGLAVGGIGVGAAGTKRILELDAKIKHLRRQCQEKRVEMREARQKTSAHCQGDCVITDEIPPCP